MFFGRENELKMLSDMYESRNFRFMVVYGRHRAGITSILREFARDKDFIYYCAQFKNNSLSLADFSKILQRHFDKDYTGSFSDWENAFGYLSAKLGVSKRGRAAAAAAGIEESSLAGPAADDAWDSRAKDSRFMPKTGSSDEAKAKDSKLVLKTGSSVETKAKDSKLVLKTGSSVETKAKDSKLVIIIEEFHRIAYEDTAIIGLLQQLIDRTFRTRNILLIISDSDIGFVEKTLLGYDSPFYGRINGQMEVRPFDYLSSSKFLPAYSPADRILSYGILGGIPCYAGQFDDALTIRQNIAKYILRDGSFLKNEPQTILRKEFREPAVYNSILEVIASGAHRMNDIAYAAHEESQKCSKYLNTLRIVGLIQKVTPAGDDDMAKKSLYMFSGNFFNFWYRFVFRGRSDLDLKDPDTAAGEILDSEDFKVYMNQIFKIVCREYIARVHKSGKLPFTPSVLGRWWSGATKNGLSHDIDVLAADRDRTSAIFGRCRFCGGILDTEDFNALAKAARGFGKVENAYYYLFSGEGFSAELLKKARKNKNIKLIGLEDLFKI